MERTFSIAFEDDLGPMWMNKDNLLICLNTKEHCGEGTILEVEDVTDRLTSIEAAMQENCKHLLVSTKPLICGYFNDGDRYRQECILTDCPAVEEEEGK